MDIEVAADFQRRKVGVPSEPVSDHRSVLFGSVVNRKPRVGKSGHRTASSQNHIARMLVWGATDSHFSAGETEGRVSRLPGQTNDLIRAQCGPPAGGLPTAGHGSSTR